MEENVNNVNNDDGNGPVNQAAQVDYGFDEDFIGDSQFTLSSRRDIYLLNAGEHMFWSDGVVAASLFRSRQFQSA